MATQDIENKRTTLRAPNIDLVTRLRRIMEILDGIVPDAEEDKVAVQGSLALALKLVARNEIASAILSLKNTLRQNPLWLRGYLLLATIYEETQAIEKAIMSLQNGINICRASLRSLAMQSCALPKSGTFSHEVRSRIMHRALRLSRHDQILRHRLAQVLVENGHLEEGLECWAELEGLHCA